MLSYTKFCPNRRNVISANNEPDALSRLEAATSFERGAKIIYEQDAHTNFDSVPAMYLLLGFAFELAMKAMLAADGVKNHRLKSGRDGIGHDLQEAFCEMAKRDLLMGQHDRLYEVILQLQPGHRNLQFDICLLMAVFKYHGLNCVLRRWTNC
jgi:hypothetical protein